MSSSTLLSGLNERQRAAVCTTEGPLLVLAGAGSGKTRVITHRICYLIEQGVAPESILAVTFTNKAAREMRERTHALIAEYGHLARTHDGAGPTVTTFHSLCVRMLREHHAALNLRRHFTIYDKSDSTRATKRAIEAAGLSPKQFEPRTILGTISRAKGNAQTREAFADHAGNYYEETVADIWERYEQICREEHALDFDDLLLRTLTLLQHNPPILKSYRERFRYIHVDEYQDTNTVQYELARLLAGDAQNICVVGDVDQNIYSWRGAKIENILQFERHFPGATTIFLEENYRSTQTIIAASNTIITKNKNRPEKNVFTKNAAGEPIALYVAYNETDEARFIAKTAQSLIAAGAAAGNIAILFRTNFQSRALEEAFLGADVPYQVLGVRFFERKEVKDVLSFLRLSLNPESTADLSRVINVPPRGIGKVTLLKLIEGRRSDITGATLAKVAAFETMMAEIAAHARTKPLAETLRFIIKRTGLEDTLKEGGEEELERLENLRELVSLAGRYDALVPEAAVEQLLEDAALQSDQDELGSQAADGDSVKLMTIHAAKGLEFPYVFVAGLEEGLFPHERLSDERTDEEEERRLFYVALTRAGKKLFLSYAGMRTIFGSKRINAPSSFLHDLDEEHIESMNPKEPTSSDGSGGGFLGDVSDYEPTINID